MDTINTQIVSTFPMLKLAESEAFFDAFGIRLINYVDAFPDIPVAPNSSLAIGEIAMTLSLSNFAVSYEHSLRV